jgi:hypothetical protein
MRTNNGWCSYSYSACIDDVTGQEAVIWGICIRNICEHLLEALSACIFLINQNIIDFFYYSVFHFFPFAPLF